MKIGFDISQTCESKAGCGFYADQIVQALARVDHENEYILLPWFYDYRPRTFHHATKIKSSNFSVRMIKNFTEEELEDLDIIYSNNFRFPKNTKAKKIVTIYDVGFMDNPDFTTEANRTFCYQGTLDSVLFADVIIAISNYTKERLLHFFPMVNPDKIIVLHCGNRDALLKEKEKDEVLKKHGLIKNDYYLSVGTIEPRKNYLTLLKAYAAYKEGKSTYKKLCIAGGYGWMEEQFEDNIKQLGLEKDVVVTGYVSDEELANLYRNMFTFIYPTWYEGFGLPVLEAMNFKKPVIVSNVTSIPEITGEAAILIDPNHFEEITMGMDRLENDEELYNSLVKDGFERTKLFSWDMVAKKIVNLY